MLKKPIPILNDLNVISILNKNFGFIPAEVEEMLDFYEIGDYKEEAKKWYDGHLFGETEVLWQKQ